MHSPEFIHRLVDRGFSSLVPPPAMGRFTHVFDESLPGPDALGDVDDGAVVAAIAGWARVEAAAAARRLAAVAELADRRNATAEEGDSAHWACDGWDAASAEVAAAHRVGHRVASGLLHQAIALRYRLPRVGELFLAGEISPRVASSITWRTRLIEEAEALAAVDADVVARAKRWGPLSQLKLEQAVDVIVERHDPGALLRFQGAARGRDVKIGDRDDEAGTTSMWGRLLATDAVVLGRRLDAMARSVCSDDPRTMGERRADALGTLGAGGDVLACACGTATCAAAVRDARADAVVIHIVADAAALQDDPGVEPGKPRHAELRDASTDAHPLDAEPVSAAGEPVTADEQPAAHDGATASATSSVPTSVDKSSLPTDPTEPSPPPRGCSRPDKPPAIIAGGGLVPAPLLAELVRLGAPMRRLSAADVLCAEPGYRPSAAMQRFVRSRDLTCRFPGCDVPAERCDVDHTVPYPVGLTHPSNLKCLCRKHHLLKTFWSGKAGWRDEQLPDGRVVWTSPTGAIYPTHPGSRIYFPDWDVGTSALPGAAVVGVGAGAVVAERGLKMPTRRRTRAQERARGIRIARARNDPFLAPPPPF